MSCKAKEIKHQKKILKAARVLITSTCVRSGAPQSLPGEILHFYCDTAASDWSRQRAGQPEGDQWERGTAICSVIGPLETSIKERRGLEAERR